ncbi:MAG TPA: hypothetical protein VMF65_16190 [Acidimicrobiales bacterium]|nr:hypothetical protein [Acidimicrobiales bacterium]
MSTRRELRRSIVSFEASLGPTAGSVAANLLSMNVTGVPKDSTRCALARCLWAIVGPERSITNIVVTDRSIYIKRSRGHIPLVVSLPKPLKTFIRAFDSGCYPELIGRDRTGPEVAGPELTSVVGDRSMNNWPSATSLSGHSGLSGHKGSPGQAPVEQRPAD